jgi:hypothetical protein
MAEAEASTVIGVSFVSRKLSGGAHVPLKKYSVIYVLESHDLT